ncbi:oligopeptide transporter, putative [Talaromyces stipitatus ATCC 10500]|uniref:Oligopeptide transporter, putative n=1 Tax=Talaromyces stipitatus (strain ATCC 10500 / CBS 375.48 / QM 6759 / NRRL 1006) TaxID=441959 RepID=B8MAX0_TALSN|nr:oligopeptide transporter, putative [Talaromyces stipitatus ATCC 10500]EED18671.1 oligopeptide transporter, putative [Talaromyces stipitatus ATCC 10500]
MPKKQSERQNATEEEIQTSGAKRFTFYAVTTPWQNYTQYPRDSNAIPGALGLGQATATTLSSAFYAFTLFSSVPFAILSDAWLGRYKTLCICFFLNFCGCLVVFVTSLPAVEEHSVKVVGLALSMFLLGFGTGGVKATISPFIGDQYTTMVPQLVVTKTGERAVTGRMLTLQYIYNVFYWFTSIASLSLVASTYLEKKGNVLPQAIKVIIYSVREGFQLDGAKPAYQLEKACFVLYHLCNNQSVNNLITQAGQIRLDGIPNDTIKALNPVVCVLLGPIIQKFLYPSLRRIGIPFRPIARMTWAFITMGGSVAVAAVIQKLIYTRGPCYDHPLACKDDTNRPNDISVWSQTPIYFLLATAEILGFTTLSEYSYSEAPKNMRTLVQALAQLSSGVGSALEIVVSHSRMIQRTPLLRIPSEVGGNNHSFSPSRRSTLCTRDARTREGVFGNCAYGNPQVLSINTGILAIPVPWGYPLYLHNVEGSDATIYCVVACRGALRYSRNQSFVWMRRFCSEQMVNNTGLSRNTQRALCPLIISPSSSQMYWKIPSDLAEICNGKLSSSST